MESFRPPKLFGIDKKLNDIKEKNFKEQQNFDKNYAIVNLVSPFNLNNTAQIYLNYLVGDNNKAKDIINTNILIHYGYLKPEQCDSFVEEQYVEPITGFVSCKPKTYIQQERIDYLEDVNNIKENALIAELTREENNLNPKSNIIDERKKMLNNFLKSKEEYKLAKEQSSLFNKMYPNQYEVYINKLYHAIAQKKPISGNFDCPLDNDPNMINTERVILSDGSAICLSKNKLSVKDLFGKYIRQDNVDETLIQKIKDVMDLFKNMDEIRQDNISDVLSLLHKKASINSMKDLANKVPTNVLNNKLLNIVNKDDDLNAILPGMYLGMRNFFPEYFAKNFNFRDYVKFMYGEEKNINTVLEEINQGKNIITGGGKRKIIPLDKTKHTKLTKKKYM